MKSYKELQVEIKNLQQQAEKVRQIELAKAIEEIKAKIQEYGITERDLFGGATKKRENQSGVVQPKYRNKETGETWTGRGKPPKWIAGKDKNLFLIKE